MTSPSDCLGVVPRPRFDGRFQIPKYFVHSADSDQRRSVGVAYVVRSREETLEE